MPGRTKRVTAADVAHSLGLSRATVGYVLNDIPGQTIPDGTRTRVVEAARRLGYRPNQAARTLASGHSRIVLLVLPDWPVEHSLRVHLDEAATALDEAGYSLVTMTPHAGGKAQPLWETLNPDVVLGLAGLTPAQRDAITALGIRIAGTGAATADQLGYALGPRLQIEHLLGRGCRRIAFAGSADPRLHDLVAQRRDLARQTLADQGLVLAGSADVSDASAGALLGTWLATGVDGVAAYNDDIAALVVGAALRRGVRVPADLAVIGHDDTPLARLLVPSLSSVRIDTRGLGRYIAALALSCIEDTPMPQPGPEFTATITQREST